MPTIPTGRVERLLRALYLRWVRGLRYDSSDLQDKLAWFEREAFALIEREGGRVAMLGALADFPAAKSLDLSLFAGKVYDEMQLAAIKAGIVAGLSAKDVAQQMFAAGLGQSYRSLERIARTETVRAYWNNAWSSIADLPDLVMLWGSEDGPRTCAWCRERDGLVIDGPDVRDHPNGRCTPVPTLRKRVEYRGSVRVDGTIYWDSRWEQTQDSRLASALVPPRDVAPPL